MTTQITLQVLERLFALHPAVKQLSLDHDDLGWRGENHEIPPGTLHAKIETPPYVHCEVAVIPPRPSDGYIDVTTFVFYALPCKSSTLEWLRANKERADLFSTPDFYPQYELEGHAMFGICWVSGVTVREDETAEEIAGRIIKKAIQFFASDEAKRSVEYLRDRLGEIDRGEVTA